MHTNITFLKKKWKYIIQIIKKCIEIGLIITFFPYTFETNVTVLKGIKIN